LIAACDADLAARPVRESLDDIEGFLDRLR
jgi:hypothetical protein